MDAIEAQVQLPKGAAPLARYARYYTVDNRNNVVAEYVMPMPPLRPGDGCSEIRTDNELHDIPCPPTPTDPYTVAPGQHRWVESENDLPGISDGGCSVVTLIYSRARQKIERVTCNGRG